MTTNTSTIGDALFTKTQQRVLGLLYGRRDQSFYLNEIVRLAAIGKGSVNRELENLCAAGLPTVVRQGNQDEALTKRHQGGSDLDEKPGSILDGNQQGPCTYDVSRCFAAGRRYSSADWARLLQPHFQACDLSGKTMGFESN